MHSLLEAYLGEVAAHMSQLPSARRADELREMRTHLENAVIVGREMGRTEDEAVRDAVEQFGMPGELGEKLVWAWRREQALNKRSLFGAAACYTAVTLLLDFFAVRPLLLLFLAHSHSPFVSHAQIAAFEWSLLGFQLVSPVLAGIASAIFFPKKAISGTLIGWAICCFYWWGSLAVYTAAGTHFFHFRHQLFVSQTEEDIKIILASLLIAWPVSQLRTARPRRGYPAAAK